MCYGCPNFFMLIFFLLQLTFNVDTCRKNYVLKEAGKLLRTFRTNLANTYLKDENGNYIENPPTEPPEKYASMISEDVWKDFVVKRMDTSFEVIYNIQMQCIYPLIHVDKITFTIFLYRKRS